MTTDVRGHVALLRQRGLAVCKPDPAQKKPTYRGWPTHSLEVEDFAPGNMVGILGGPLSDGGRPGHALVIIDLDGREAVELADNYLTATGMVEGRPGKPRSHRYFLVPLNSIPDWARSPADQAAKAAGQAAGHPGPWTKSFRHRETRQEIVKFCGTGAQCVAPPSDWAGAGGVTERREWEGGEPGEPAVVLFLDLWDAVGRLASRCGADVREAAPPRTNGTPSRRFKATAGASAWDRAVAYVAKCPPAVSHQGGHDQTFAVARYVVYGFDLGADAGFKLLAEHYNPRCQPEWSEKELRHKCEDADSLEFGKPRGWLRDAERPTNGKHHPGDDPPDGPPDESDLDPGPDPSREAEAVHLTDVGNAQRVVKDHGHDFHFCHPWKSWYTWDRRRWAADDTGEVVRRVKETQAALYRWAAEKIRDAGKPGDDEEAKSKAGKLIATLKHALKWEDARRVAACLEMMKSEPGVPVLPSQLDADPFLFNCANGTLDLRTGKLHPHCRGDLLSKLSGVSYDPTAPCPVWLRFLDRVMDGNTDLTDYLRRVVGYCLTGAVSEQAIWFLHGAGQNGKSTFLGAVLEMMGDYGMQAVAELLMARAHETHPTERADLFGRRFVATIETEEGKRLAESLMKQLTGGDKVRARRMRQDFIEFAPTHKLFLAANHKPRVKGTDLAVWRRIKLIPFTVTIPDEEKDKDLPSKLRAELPGVLAWAVRGCLEWQRHGLGEPDEVRQATDAYKAEQDTLQVFLNDCCDVRADARVSSSALLRAYVEWSGDRWMTATAFAKRLKEKGFEARKTGGVMQWHGLGLLPQETGPGEGWGHSSG